MKFEQLLNEVTLSQQGNNKDLWKGSKNLLRMIDLPNVINTKYGNLKKQKLTTFDTDIRYKLPGSGGRDFVGLTLTFIKPDASNITLNISVNALGKINKEESKRKFPLGDNSKEFKNKQAPKIKKEFEKLVKKYK